MANDKALNIPVTTTVKSAFDQAAISEAADIIKSGSLVAFPTETVYGLGGAALNSSACKQIFEAKGRPSDNPLIVHVADMDMLRAVIGSCEQTHLQLKRAEPLIQAYWPGPLTLIFNKANNIDPIVSGGLSTIAVRMPQHKAALELIKAAKTPIAAPSANKSGSPSPTTADHVKADLDGIIPLILDGGPAKAGLESTILDMTTDTPAILRPGHITQEMLEELIGPVSLAYEQKLGDDEAPKAPGMKYRHYAPKAKLTVISAKRPIRIVNYIRTKSADTETSSGKTVVLAPFEFLTKYNNLGLNLDVRELSPESLFAALRRLDTDAVDHAFIHAPEAAGVNAALLNRLNKAAGGNIINLDTVLFVCTGNTCRSPMAEALWNHKNTGCPAKSRGISAFPGGINPNSEKALKGLELSLANHESGQITVSDVEEAALVLCMTKKHADFVKQLGYPEKTFTLSEYAGFSGDVPDPFGQSLESYEDCAKTIDMLISKIIENREITKI